MCGCRAQWLFVLIVVALGVLAMLNGCGKKGPLYLPKEKASLTLNSTTSQPVTSNQM